MNYLPSSPLTSLTSADASLNVLNQHIKKYKDKLIILLVDKNARYNTIAKEIIELIDSPNSIILTSCYSEPQKKQIEETQKYITSQGKDEASLIVALGGGSTIDTAKILSVLLANDTFEIPERFQFGIDPKFSKIPVIAIPSTVGTGAELSPAAIYESSFGKIGIVDNLLIPDKSLIIPELCISLPENNLISSISDGVAHSFEGLLSSNSTIYSDALHSHSIMNFVKGMALRSHAPDQSTSYYLLCEASICSGTATKVSGVNIVHTLASFLTRLVEIPHGISILIAFYEVLKFEPIWNDVAKSKLELALGSNARSKLISFVESLPISHNLGSYGKLQSIASIPDELYLEQSNRIKECILDVRKSDIEKMVENIYQS